MINPKTVQRKKSQTLIAIKDHHKEEQTMIKRKKSVSNIVCSSKLKKQVINDKQQKPTKKNKQQKQKKLVHSVSKGKLNKKHHKSQKNDENYNSMNHKRSIDKFHTVGKNSKQLIKTKKESDQIKCEGKNQKVKNGSGQCYLTRIGSVGKFSGLKKGEKKKGECKETIDEKHFLKNDQQKIHEEKLKNASTQVAKTLTKNPTTKKLITGQKSKLKKFQSTSQVRKSTRQKIKPNSKLAQIIQRSILYSDVNYDFKQQISFLGSGIKRQEDFFMQYPFQFEGTKSSIINKEVSQRTMIQHEAAITIQKHFRGYIQRKYIEQARYIIDCIKKIQRFWRNYLLRKKQFVNRIQVNRKEKSTIKGEIQSSLITVKDLNEDTSRGKEICPESRSGSNGEIDKNMLKDIIKNLLLEETVGESIKQKIRSVMMDENKKIGENEPKQKQKPQDSTQKSPTTQTRFLTKPNPSSLQIETQLQNDDQQHTKQNYVKRKISMQISSERNFNSPMSSASKEFLTSPNLKRLTSPKCLSSSFSKDMKGNYNNFFKSNKNGVFMSPKSSKEEGQRILMSHSGSKWSKQKQPLIDGSCVQQVLLNQNKVFSCYEPKRQFQSEVLSKPQLTSQGKSTLELSKADYLLKTEISQSSPIIQCKSPSQSFTQEVNFLETRNMRHETECQKRNLNDQHFSPSLMKSFKPFPTEFCFIEEFCLLITDYLREDEDTTEVFLQKVKGLKYCKVQKVFQQWENIQFQDYWCQNQPLGMMILLQHSNRPAIFSLTQKNLLLEYPSLRLFLSQNDYSAQEISFKYHPKAAYVKFMFDVFQQCIYENYRHVGLKELALLQSKQNRKGTDYMSVILSQAMGNMLRSAQMLCGSFDGEDMMEVERQERKLMNQMRLGEMIKEYREDKLDDGSCVMWIQLLLGKLIFEDIIEESIEDVIHLITRQ